jgi:hypothetical protein
MGEKIAASPDARITGGTRGILRKFSKKPRGLKQMAGSGRAGNGHGDTQPAGETRFAGTVPAAMAERLHLGQPPALGQTNVMIALSD